MDRKIHRKPDRAVIRATTLVVLLVSLAAVASCARPPATDLEVVVKNQTGRQLTDLRINDGQNKVPLPPIASGGSQSVRLKVPDFTDGSAIVLYDPATQKNYFVVGFFEGTLTGRLEVNLDKVGTDGMLTGRVLDASSHLSAPRWFPLSPG